MNNHEDNNKDFIDQESFIRIFSSQEEAELYNLKQDIVRSDVEKFHLLCRMMRIDKMLSSFRIVKENIRVKIVDQELLEFWKVLNKHYVKYIMVGGIAVNVQAYSWGSFDPGIWLKDELINRQNLIQSFAELGCGTHTSLETMNFDFGWIQLKVAGGIILNIMTSVKGLDSQSFEDCYQRTKKANIDGVEVPFLHINDLIANKKAVFRLRDQVDVQELEKIQKIAAAEAHKKG